MFGILPEVRFTIDFVTVPFWFDPPYIVAIFPPITFTFDTSVILSLFDPPYTVILFLLLFANNSTFELSTLSFIPDPYIILFTIGAAVLLWFFVPICILVITLLFTELNSTLSWLFPPYTPLFVLDPIVPPVILIFVLIT